MPTSFIGRSIKIITKNLSIITVKPHINLYKHYTHKPQNNKINPINNRYGNIIINIINKINPLKIHTKNINKKNTHPS